MRKIYDCFLFFNELELLEMRLNVMDPYVDYFVITEASVTHSGIPKPYNFEANKEMFSKFLHKIIYIKNDDIPNDFVNLPQIKNIDSFEGQCVKKIHELIETQTGLFDRRTQPYFGRDFFQKESIRKGLENCQDDDIIISSDLDEIPNPEILKNIDSYLDKANFFTFVQKTYYYYLNFLKETNWKGSRLSLYKNVKDYSYNKLRAQQNYDLENGGWHFSFMGGPERVKTKITSYSHQDLNNPYVISSVENNIENAIDPFFRGSLTKVEIDNTYPEYLLNNLDRYSHMIKK
jgi:beta-1,4-mannosyl-glycoprotein beta-1,4-N-acetylglucosaminyltransferase